MEINLVLREKVQDDARKVSRKMRLCKSYGYREQKSGEVPEVGEESLVPEEEFLTGR